MIPHPTYLEGINTITGILSAIPIGAVVGAPARLVVRGKQRIGVLLTVSVGVDWLELR